MRAFDLAVYIFTFNLILGFLGGVYNTSVPQADIQVGTALNYTISENQSYAQVFATNIYLTLIGPWNLLTSLLQAIFLTGFYLQNLFPIIPSELAGIITALCNLIYATAIIQFFSGRNLRDYV